jgi:glycosyltransferase involved in cell wall biosynthesis
MTNIQAKNKPKADLTVIITNFNKPFVQIKQCIDSIHNQTVIPKEIFLIDDGSESFDEGFFDIPVLKLPANEGVVKARDYGFNLSTGRVILFVDADDYLAFDFIEKCGRKIASADIVYPNLMLFGEESNLIELPKKLSEEYLLNLSSCLPVTSMMHRYVYETLGGFNNLPIYEDWEFYLRAFFDEGFTFAKANTLLYYRQSANSRLNSEKDDFKKEVAIQICSPYF